MAFLNYGGTEGRRVSSFNNLVMNLDSAHMYVLISRSGRPFPLLSLTGKAEIGGLKKSARSRKVNQYYVELSR